MEVVGPAPHTRTAQRIVRKTLKDGTVREYTYNKTYTVTSNHVRCGKKELKSRIDACKDKQKIIQLRQWMDQNGM